VTGRSDGTHACASNRLAQRRHPDASKRNERQHQPNLRAQGHDKNEFDDERSKVSRKSDLEGFNLNDRDGRLTRNMFTFRVREFVDSPEGCLTAGAWWNTEHLAARTAHNRLRVDASMQIVSSMRRFRKI
jgi:hypothetical protein